MFKSHLVSKSVSHTDEYRVFILGDSSIWGTLLKPEDTLAGKLNKMEIKGQDQKPIHFYNLGYPTLSITKDLLLLEKSLEYDPDMFIWVFTLESFPTDKQLSSPLVANNSRVVSQLMDKYRLDFYNRSSTLSKNTYWNQTLFGQRRNLADIFRLQLYGVMWAITGIDQFYPTNYQPAARDLTQNTVFHDWNEGDFTQDDLNFDILLAGQQAAGEIPILFINEPIMISSGLNSEIRYNFYYPRWAFDQYRIYLSDFTRMNDLKFKDAWNIVPESEFTNTAIHTTPRGVQMLANKLVEDITRLISP
jgi:hypothetical protein